MKRTAQFEYTTALKYASIFILFLLFNGLEKELAPYSNAISIVAMNAGCSVIFTPLLHLACFIVTGKTGLLAQATIANAVYVIIYLIYKKFAHTPKYEIVLYSFVCMLGFVFVGDTLTFIPYIKRIFIALFCSLIALFSFIASSFFKRGLKFKPRYEEVSAILALIVLVGVGTSNVISPLVWKGVSIFLILITTFVMKSAYSTVLACSLGISLAVYYGELSYVSIFLVYSIVAVCFMPISRYLSALSIPLADYLMFLLFPTYTVYDLTELLPVVIGVAVFAVIPHKPLKNLKEKLYSFREKQLTRVAINRNRQMLSNRLYELSSVFAEMSNAFTAFKKSALSQDRAKNMIQKQIYSNVCKVCPAFERCHPREKSIRVGIDKMIDIGFAKGKLSLIDIPKDIGDFCLHPNNVLYAINKLLADYRSYLIDNANVENGRRLIADQAEGVSKTLKSLALSSGTILKYQSRLERALSQSLMKNGFSVSELLIYGEEQRLTVSIVLTMKEFSLEHLTRIICENVGAIMQLAEKADITEGKYYLSFEKSANFDAVFGLAKVIKDGSEKSGDTHSVARISSNKFLVALSDGMGSGQNAENISSISLSLIESFYKAGLESNLILNTVNKLLAITTEDSFAALDVGVIDLNTATADFIKYGSPYGFIVGEKGIRIIEGNCLPLGILEELKPQIATAPLDDGDMIVLCSDGITDSIGASADVIDFLRSQPALNPQTLADGILNYALSVANGKRADDMTVLCVRVYKKTSNTAIA